MNKLKTHTRENLESLCDFFTEIINMCIEEDVTLLGTAAVEIFKESIPKIDMENYLNILAKRMIDQEKKQFIVIDKIISKDEVHFRENLLTLIDDNFQDSFQPYMDLLDVTDVNGENVVNEDYKSVLWDYARSFAVFSVKYAHLVKKPALHERDGKTVKIYTQSKDFPDVSATELSRISKLLKIELKF